MPKGVNGPALAMMAIGGVFAYSGIRGYSVLTTIQALISGKTPPKIQTTGIGTPTLASSAAGQSPGMTDNPAAGQWTHSGLMTLWQSNGGSASTANNAACHAIQESSGNASVTSPNPGGGINVGLWQLDTEGVGKGYTVAQLQNPNINAMVAVKGSKNGTDWSEWATPGC